MYTSKCLYEKVSFLSNTWIHARVLFIFLLYSKSLFSVNAVKSMRLTFKIKTFILPIFRMFGFKNVVYTTKLYLAGE